MMWNGFTVKSGNTPDTALLEKSVIKVSVFKFRITKSQSQQSEGPSEPQTKPSFAGFNKTEEEEEECETSSYFWEYEVCAGN